MHTYLLCQWGRKAGIRVPLETRTFVIGRDVTCHLRPKSAEVSSRHCAIISRNGTVALKDLGSETGTYVNGRRVQSECRIQSGDKLRVGPLEFVVVMDLAGQRGAGFQPAGHRDGRPIAAQSPPDAKERPNGADAPVPRLNPPEDADVLLVDLPCRPAAVPATELLEGARQMEQPADPASDDSPFPSATVVYVSPGTLERTGLKKQSA